MKIVYYLITHKNENQIKRLVRCLRSSENSFVLIHHDAKSTPLCFPQPDGLCILDNPVDVKWGDISQVHAMWKGIEWLIQKEISFDWVIFLSGQDYPVKPVPEIEAELQQTTSDGYVQHEVISQNPDRHERYYHTLCWQRYFFRRLEIPGLKPRDLKRRHPYRNGVRCFAGSNWLNLSRKAVEYLWIAKDTVSALSHYLRKAPCPDETVFQTILMNGSALDIRNSSKRFIRWQETSDNPETLTLEHLGEIRSSDAWFARKMHPSKSAALLDQLDEIVLS